MVICYVCLSGLISRRRLLIKFIPLSPVDPIDDISWIADLPTDPFTILEARKPLIDEIYVFRKQQQIAKLQKNVIGSFGLSIYALK